MSRWGKPTKNKKRRDPRYFLNESVEGEETLNEFELGFDLDDESDEELMRDQEWVEREKKKMMPAVEAVMAFLQSDEPEALGIERSTLSKYSKYFSPLVRLLNADQEYLVKLYNASQDEREGRTPMAEQSRRMEDSVVVKQAKEKGFPLAAAAAIGLATLDTSDGPTLLQNANKYIYKGKLGQLIQGAGGIYAHLDRVVRNFRGTRKKQFKPVDDGGKGREAMGMFKQGGGSQGYRLEEIIKEELKQVISEVKIDGYDYGLRGRDRLEFNMAMRNDPGAAREVARMSVERVGDWWEDYKIKQDEYEPPPGDDSGHPYDYPPGQEGRYRYNQYGYEE